MNATIPQYFKPLLWEYDFSAVDPAESPRLLITKAINYGDMRHWRWVAGYYGAGTVRQTLMALAAPAIRPGARALAEIVFAMPHVSANDPIAPRGSHN